METITVSLHFQNKVWYRVTKKEWTPLSCKFDLFLIILGKSSEIISYWLGLDKSFAVFQVPGYEHSSLLLP